MIPTFDLATNELFNKLYPDTTLEEGIQVREMVYMHMYISMQESMVCACLYTCTMYVYACTFISHQPDTTLEEAIQVNEQGCTHTGRW